MLHQDITEKIIGCAMSVHRALGPGFLESVYTNALAHELVKNRLPVELRKAIKVTYDGVIVGDFFADMVIGGHIIVELKAVRALAPEHEVQLVNYLVATGIDIGLMLNFGASSLEIKRKHRIFRPKEAKHD
jgi:GxxExxY protein